MPPTASAIAFEAPALVVDRVTKHFGGVEALTDVHLEFNKGEIVGLVGSNGAGKSTLLNVIWGVFPPDAGRLFVNGEEVRRISPEKARDLGISIIFQHRRLMPHMTIAENIFIEDMPKVWGRIDYRRLHRDAARLLEMLDLKLDTRRLVADLTAEEKQLVEIVKACAKNPKILLMDEPTSALRQHEVDTLFGIMRRLRDNGCSVVFISHRLKEVLEVCDRISIIRDGRNVVEGPAEEFTADRIVECMSGVERVPARVAAAPPAGQGPAAAAELLRVEGLSVGTARDIGFTLHVGEILGFAGLGGSGIGDVYKRLFGLLRGACGTVTIAGQEVTLKNPRQAIRHGIGLVPEDRQLDGEFLEMSVRDNICIPMAQRRPLFAPVRRAREYAVAEKFVDELAIKTDSVHTPMKNLSGGNQQKAVIAKWLAIGSRILLMDEPTAGIDEAAKGEVTRCIRDIAGEGKGVIYTSSYITELMDVADRILVVYRGRIFKTFLRAEYDHNRIYLAINGIDEEGGS